MISDWIAYDIAHYEFYVSGSAPDFIKTITETQPVGSTLYEFIPYLNGTVEIYVYQAQDYSILKQINIYEDGVQIATSSAIGGQFAVKCGHTYTIKANEQMTSGNAVMGSFHIRQKTMPVDRYRQVL